MEGNSLKEKNEEKIYILNNILEALETCLSRIFIITKILADYDENEFNKNFDLEIEFDLLKLNARYLENILFCFTVNKAEDKESNTIKLLKLMDFVLYEFKRLRIKYEEISEFYFSLDQENKIVNNIKRFMEKDSFIHPRKFCLWLLKLLSHHLKKLEKILNSLTHKNFRATNKEKQKFQLSNRKIQNLCDSLFYYVFLNEEEITKIMKKNDILMSIRNFKDVEKSSIWIQKLTSFLQSIYFEIGVKESNKNHILVKIKNGLSIILKNIIYTNKSKILYPGLIPEIEIIKLFFETLEQQNPSNSNFSFGGEPCKTNEIIYLPLKNLEKFRLYNEKMGIKKIATFGNDNIMKIRILTNQLIKVNYDIQNLVIHKQFEESNTKEINFFGLLLKVSKEFLIPSYNLIFHVNGGGFLSQSSESHLSYLKKWSYDSESVIISLDYKLFPFNRFPILFDSCNKSYEIITTLSNKLFNFNIKKVIIYSDSVGSLIALNIINYAIENKIKVPDAAVFVFPIPNLINEIPIEDSFSFLSLQENCIFTQIRENFLDLEHKELSVFKEDHRLNFFKTDSNIIKYFPKVFILSAANEPIKENAYNLFEYFKNNNVEVSFKQLIYYSNGFLKLSSILENHYKKTLEYAYEYIIDVFKDIVISISQFDKNTIESNKSPSTSCKTFASI